MTSEFARHVVGFAVAEAEAVEKVYGGFASLKASDRSVYKTVVSSLEALVDHAVRAGVFDKDGRP